jgi:hypothetical protein
VFAASGAANSGLSPLEDPRRPADYPAGQPQTADGRSKRAPCHNHNADTYPT